MAESMKIEDEVWGLIEAKFDMKGERRRLSRDQSGDFLSTRISVTNDGKRVQIDNDYKIRTILEKWGATEFKPKKVPYTRHHLSQMMKDNEEGKWLDAQGTEQHRAFVGDVNWIAQTTDPMLATYVSIIGKYNKQPVEGCIAAREHMLGYLKGQIGMCLVAEAGNTEGIRYTSDSDWAGLFNIDGDCRSRYGVMVLYNGMPVAWRSGWLKPGDKGDTAIKLSSGEAEASAAAEGLKLCRHIKFIADEMLLDVPDRIHMEVDATVAVAFANNTQVRSKMKHINLKWSWVLELRDQNIVKLINIDGTKNPADVMTKVLNQPEFVKKQKSIKQMRDTS